MPASYRIDTAVRVIFSKAEGRLTDQDLLEHQSRLREDPVFNWSFDQIYDFGEVTEVDVTDDTLRRLMERQPFLQGVKRALVVRSDETRGMVEKLVAFRQTAAEQTKVFSSLEAARRWLRITRNIWSRFL